MDEPDTVLWDQTVSSVGVYRQVTRTDQTSQQIAFVHLKCGLPGDQCVLSMRT